MSLAETANAKLNLALHVRRRRADGYHELETIFAFTDFGDRLTVEPADELSLEIEGRFGAELAADADNLVLRAAEALRRRHDVTSGARIRLEKALPVASGIGGGSADAAAALRLLALHWGLDDAPLEAIATTLGADVPACLHRRTAVGTGVGERLSFPDARDVSGRSVVLVNPRLPVPTVAVFAAWDGIDHGPLPDASPWEAALCGRNDLEAAAVAICPAIRDVLEALRTCAGADLVRMSGSGATCFGVFRDEGAAITAAAAVESSHPDWWVARGKLL